MARVGKKNSTDFYELRCISCGRTVREKESSTRCPSCRAPLDVHYDLGYIRSRLNRYSLRNSPAKALKYLDFYPLRNLDLVVSMNEGGTPLYRCPRLPARCDVLAPRFCDVLGFSFGDVLATPFWGDVLAPQIASGELHLCPGTRTPPRA